MFASGSNLPSEQEAISHFGSGKLFIDARAGTANIPGDGTAKITFTSAQDTGKFVAASLDLDRWEEVSGIVGQTTTWNEVVDVADAITGKRFLRTYLREGGGERAEKILENRFFAEVRIFSPIWSTFTFIDRLCLIGHAVDGRWPLGSRAQAEPKTFSATSSHRGGVPSPLLGRRRLVDAVCCDIESADELVQITFGLSKRRDKCKCHNMQMVYISLAFNFVCS